MGKTLKGLFSSFNKEQLNQLYFHSSYPDIDVCKNIYRITDLDVLNSTKYFSRKCGSIVEKIDIKSENNLFDNKQAEFYHHAKKKKNYLIAVRDILWGLRKWNSNELDKWLNSVKPNVIFFAAGDAIFPYSIVLMISKRMNIPLVIYFCDDYYNYKKDTLSVIYNIHNGFLKRKIEKTVLHAQELIYISDSMNEEYKRLFGKTGVTIMTPYENKIDSCKEQRQPLIMTYAGNVSLNRWKTLILIGKALSEINSDGIKAILNIYSGSKDLEITNQLTLEDSIYFKGNLKAEELMNVIKETDILVHAESFELNDISRIKHSISTKIPNYLASNRLILAVGPIEAASIYYLKKNVAAYTISNVNDLKFSIQDLVKNFRDFRYINTNAFRLSEINHSEKSSSLKLQSLLTEIVNNNQLVK
jgi:hypothetical protein